MALVPSGLIQPLALESPYAMAAGLNRPKRKKNKNRVVLMLGECCSLWLTKYFCLWGRFADTQGTVAGKEEEQEQRKLLFPFFLSCHKM